MGGGGFVQAFQNRLQYFPDVFRHNRVALGSRVNAISLIQLRNPADPFKQERDEGGVIASSQFGTSLLKCAGVFLAHIGRHSVRHVP